MPENRVIVYIHGLQSNGSGIGHEPRESSNPFVWRVEITVVLEREIVVALISPKGQTSVRRQTNPDDAVRRKEDLICVDVAEEPDTI